MMPVQSAYETAVPGPCSGPMCCNGNSLVSLNHAAPTYDCFDVSMGGIPQNMAGVSNISARPVFSKPIGRCVCPEQGAQLHHAPVPYIFIRGAGLLSYPMLENCNSFCDRDFRRHCS